MHESNDASNKLNRVAQIALVVVNIALRGAHVFVSRQRLHHPHINAHVRQFGQKLSSSRDRQPFERFVRCRIVAKADSIGLLVRMLCQC
jgi:hypothetical protein